MNEMPSGEQIALHYDRYADKYEYLVTTIGYIEPEMIKDLIAPYHFGPETKVIDFGCGTGLVGQQLQKIGL